MGSTISPLAHRSRDREIFALIIATLVVLGLSACATAPASPADLRYDGSQHVLVYEHVAQKDIQACGLAVLSGVASYWGRPTSQEAVGRSLSTGTEGSILLGDLQDWAEKNDFHAIFTRPSRDRIMRHVSLGRPVIVSRRVFPRLTHLEVVVGFDSERRKVLIDDPRTGKYWDSWSSFDGRLEQAGSLSVLLVPRGPLQTATPH